jgi:hypothetical protein
VTASRPLTASAQTHPGWSSINLRSPDRAGTLSSAIRTRVNRSSQTTNTLSSRVTPVDTDNRPRKVRNNPMGRLKEPLGFDAYALIKLGNARYCMCPIRDYVLYDVRHINWCSLNLASLKRSEINTGDQDNRAITHSVFIRVIQPSPFKPLRCVPYGTEITRTR